MEEIQQQYETQGASVLTRNNDEIEGRNDLFDDADYTQKVATGIAEITPEKMLSNGTITSKQYNTWKAKYGG